MNLVIHSFPLLSVKRGEKLCLQVETAECGHAWGGGVLAGGGAGQGSMARLQSAGQRPVGA